MAQVKKIRRPAEPSSLPTSFAESPVSKANPSQAIICPVCGAIAVQEKCKIICRSETCRGRVVMNCSEF
jgi:hypothetical protein